MASYLEHSERSRHHRHARPVTHFSPDVTDREPHPGVPSACPICHPDETEEER